ncbi:MAG: hypothetical protein VB141_13270 [Burkholderia gladioli]
MQRRFSQDPGKPHLNPDQEIPPEANTPPKKLTSREIDHEKHSKSSSLVGGLRVSGHPLLPKNLTFAIFLTVPMSRKASPQRFFGHLFGDPENTHLKPVSTAKRTKTVLFSRKSSRQSRPESREISPMPTK